MLRVINQIVNPRQTLGVVKGCESDVLPSTRGMIVFVTPESQSFTHLVYLCTLGPFKTQNEPDNELVAFVERYNNSSVCKQMTTFSPLLLVSALLVNIPVLLQNEFAAKLSFIALLTNNTGFGPGFLYSNWQNSSRDQSNLERILTGLPVWKSVLLASVLLSTKWI